MEENYGWDVVGGGGAGVSRFHRGCVCVRRVFYWSAAIRASVGLSGRSNARLRVGAVQAGWVRGSFRFCSHLDFIAVFFFDAMHKGILQRDHRGRGWLRCANQIPWLVQELDG